MKIELSTDFGVRTEDGFFMVPRARAAGQVAVGDRLHAGDPDDIVWVVEVTAVDAHTITFALDHVADSKAAAS